MELQFTKFGAFLKHREHSTCTLLYFTLYCRKAYSNFLTVVILPYYFYAKTTDLMQNLQILID